MDLCRAAILPLLLSLAGCMVERGDVLPSDPREYSDAAFLEVPDDEYFWLQPPSPGNHTPAPAEQQVPKQGLWLKAGVMGVESQCFRPRKAKPQDYPIFPEYADLAPIVIRPGQRYLLKCDDYKVGRFELIVTGRLPGF